MNATAIVLRDYQDNLVAAVRASMRSHRRVLAVSPTGSGKTVVFVYIANSVASRGKRVIIIAHRAEIVAQISGALDRMGVRHGRIEPGHHLTDDAVQVAMVQTLARRLDLVPEPDLLVIDEAHHAVAGTWKHVAAAWTRCRILGVTATPTRTDGKGLADAFDAMVLGPAMSDLIAAGHLAGYDYLAPSDKLDMDGVRTRCGDWDVADLARLVERSTIVGDAVAHYQRHLAGRPAVAFCLTVAHAEAVADQFRMAGIRAAAVDGSMERTERRQRIAAIGSGGLHLLTSCELIDEGVDVPAISGAILLRPTKSLTKHLQQVGRALRPKADGGRAVILDHVGNVAWHGMPAEPRTWTLEARTKKPTAPPTRTCETCFRVFAAATVRQDAAECGGQPCPMLAPPKPGERAEPEYAAGELQAVVDPWAWAGGIDPARAHGQEWRALLAMADSEAKLRQIAKARNFKRGWVQHALAGQQRPSAGTAA